MNSSIASLQRQGVPLRLIQFALLRAGREGVALALTLHPEDEYAHVRMVRLSVEDRYHTPPWPKRRLRVRIANPIYSKNCSRQ